MLSGGEELAYAFGLNIGEFRGLDTVAHSGSMMGFKAAFLPFHQKQSLLRRALSELKEFSAEGRSEAPPPPEERESAGA